MFWLDIYIKYNFFLNIKIKTKQKLDKFYVKKVIRSLWISKTDSLNPYYVNFCSNVIYSKTKKTKNKQTFI